MKYLKDYKNTNTLIEIHNNEEYEKMIPLLNEVLRNWNSGKTYFKNGGYVNVKTDIAEDYEEGKRLINYTIIQASEFLEEKEQILTIEQLIEGEVYWSTSTAYTKGHLWKFDYFDKDSRFIYSKGGLIDNVSIFEKNVRFNDAHHLGLRKANAEESKWLELCIQKNKFIEFNEINNYMNKEAKYKEGKWYYHPKWSKNTHIKFHSIRDSNSVNRTEIINNGNFKKQINWSISYNHSLLESNLQEIQQYLPTNHPDKIVKQEEKWKVGGWVKCISDYSTAYKENLYQIVELDSKQKRVYVKTSTSEEWLNIEGTEYKLECEWIGMNKPEIPNNSSVNTFNFDKEKYYKFLWVYNNTTVYFRFDKKNHTSFWGTVTKHNNLNGYHCFNFHESKDYCEVTEQEAKGLPKQENNSIPEYVENIHYDSRSKHKIFKTSEKHNFNSLTWKEILIDNGRLKDGTFIPSTKEAYLKQEGKTEWSQFTNDFQSNSCNISVDLYKNEEIEVGDLVEIISDGSYNCSNKKVGDKFTIEEIYIVSGMTFYRPNYGKTTGVLSSYTKLIKKKHSNTTVNKQLDISSAKVGNKLTVLDIFKPKQSKTMDFTSFKQQSPKELSKISKNKYLTIN